MADTTKQHSEAWGRFWLVTVFAGVIFGLCMLLGYLGGADSPGGFLGLPFWFEAPAAMFVLVVAAGGTWATLWAKPEAS